MLYYAVDGKATYTIYGKTHEFKKNHLYIFPPNTPVSLFDDKDDPFTLAFVHVYISPEPRTMFEIDVGSDPFLTHVIKLFRLYVKRRDSVYTRKTTELIVSYLFENKEIKASSLSNDIRDYIDANFIEVFKNNDLSTVFNYSNSHLLKVFKDTFSITPRQYALNLLLQHILQLIREGYPINRISSMLDFSSPENFSKFFKKNFGCTPSSMKKRVKENVV